MKKTIGMKTAGFLMILLLVTMAACSSDDGGKADSDENPSKDQQLTEEEPPKNQPSDPDNQYPFTGIKTNDSVDDRAVGVMINNHPKARPQTGLSKADMVFEMLAEGNITRFLALFQSEKPDVIGPVRSAREYYFELANDYDALYVYHGAAGFIDQMIKDRGIQHLNGAQYDNDKHLFKRESFRNAPHNSYLLMDAVDEVAETKGYKTSHDYDPMPFLEDDEADNIKGEKAEHVEIVYSDSPMNIVEYDYNGDDQTFTRFSDHEKTVELNDETPVKMSNIMIVEAPHQVIDEAGRRAIDLESGGDAYLIQQGNVQKVQWERRSGRLLPIKDGEPVGLVPGKTWVNVVPADPGIDQSVQITQDQ